MYNAAVGKFYILMRIKMKGLEDKKEFEFYEDKDTITALVDYWAGGWDNIEIYDKESWEFIDKSKWSDEQMATRITDLMMWTWKEITMDEYKKILWDKIKDSIVLKNE